MCGIVGYTGTKAAFPILKEMLKKLEYRGYDSAGISVCGNELCTEKCVGTIDKVSEINSKATLGIGHTRWATHGKVCFENAHPHSDCKNEISVVHNGIIENYQELRAELEKQGHKFKSETDTEVVPHLIENFISQGETFESAVQKSLEKINGTYAIAAIMKNNNKIIASRKGSPLVVGVGDSEFFVSSDIPSFLEHTRNVVYLFDSDIVELNKEMKICNKGALVSREVVKIEWDAEQVKKGNFEHYMLKEICEQADVITRAVTQDDKKIIQIADEIKNAKNVFFLGCGTSANACNSISHAFAKKGIHIPVIVGSEFPNYENLVSRGSLIIALSQSGETADVIIPIRKAREKGARVVSIVNVMGSSIQRESDDFLLLNAMPEIAVASTKAYTAMLCVLYLLAYASWDELEGGKTRLKNLYNLVYNLTTISTRDHIKQIANDIKDKNHLYVIGRDLQFATAKEVALKIKEISYIHAEALPAGELKHGTLALIEEGTPVIALFSKENEQQTLNNVIEIKARGGKIIGVSYQSNENFDHFIRTNECGMLNPIVQVIPMQLLAYELSLLRGNNPDMPRNLAKSVTVV